MLNEIDKKNNKERFNELLLSTKRKNIQTLVDWLETTDFYEAPASVSHHGNYTGGLCEHSINVYEAAKNVADYITKIKGVEFKDDSLIIASLLHDLCKVNFYVPVVKNRLIEGEWKQINTWDHVDSFPFGHGEKSVLMVKQFINLKVDEMLAIRWHMGQFDAGVTLDYATKAAYNSATSMYPLVPVVNLGDITASLLVEDKMDFDIVDYE